MSQSQAPRSISAKDLLSKYGNASLLQMARQRGLEHKNQTKPAMVEALSKILYQPESIRASLDDLEPVERELLDNLILAGGEAPTGLLREQLEAEGKIERRQLRTFGSEPEPTSGSPTRRGSKVFLDLVARLGALGLVFTVDLGPYNKNVDLSTPGLVLFIPNAIMKHLPSVSVPIETAPPPAAEKPADPSLFLRDVYLLASLARRGPIGLTVRGLIPKRTLVQIDESLRVSEGASSVSSEAELGRLPLLRALEEEVGLLAPGPQSLILGTAAEEFLIRPQGERRKRLYDAYCKTKRWSELSRLQDIAVTPKDSVIGPSVAAARKRVLKEIAELPAGEWISISHLIGRIRRHAFDFLFSREVRQSHYYYGSSYYSQPTPYSGDNALGLSFYDKDGDETVGWKQVEGGFIRVVVTEALYWLGMVDLGGPEGEAPTSFRVTADGALLLQGKTPPSVEQTPQVVIQPNFQIFAFEPTGEDVLFTLDRIAERVRAEQVVEYRLTRESVYGAQRQGMETEEILAFLERVASTPLPQNVRRSLEEWGAQHERIVIRRRTPLLHAADEATLDALYGNAEIKELLGRRLGPTVALVPPQNLSQIYGYLAVRGPSQGLPLPALSEGNDAWRRGVVTADREGRLTFRDRLPSIHIKRALRPFTEEEEDGTLRLTPERLRQAASKNGSRPRGGSGAALTADEMIATLEQLNSEPLPEDVIALVRRWAKDWGKGALVETALLQVESAEIMTNLMANDELGRYLQKVPGAPTLALVQQRHADRVRQLLQEHGMLLESRLFSR